MVKGQVGASKGLRRLAAIAVALMGVGTFIATAAPAQATFPGVNGLVLFNRGGNLFTATSTGGSVKQLTTTGNITGAKWSPDGKSIAYKSGTNIYVKPYPSGATRTVATGVKSAPQWSPDGSRLAFLAELPDAPCGEQAVYTVSSATGGVATKAYDPRSDNCPLGGETASLGTYLPNSRLLLTYCSLGRGGYCEIRIVVMDGITFTYSTVTRVSCSEEDELAGTCSYYFNLSDARTAAAGNGVVFSGRGGYNTLPGSTPTPTSTTPERIYTVDTAGTRLRTVSTATSGYSPVLSPDGKVVLFTQTSGSTTNLLKSGTASTSVASRLIANASQADWRPVS